MKISIYKNSLYVIIISILLFYIGFNLTYDNSPFLNYQSGINMDGADYIKFIYIGSSHCGFANDEENHQNIINLKKSLKEFTEKNNYAFISTGISVDINAYQGVKYLEKTGPYDEIISGSNWFNAGVQKYVWENFQGKPSTPQIIITKTGLEVEEFFGIHQSEKELARVNGIYEIKEMLEQIKRMNNFDFKEFVDID